jgi:hypothetical protein
MFQNISLMLGLTSPRGHEPPLAGTEVTTGRNSDTPDFLINDFAEVKLARVICITKKKDNFLPFLSFAITS